MENKYSTRKMAKQQPIEHREPSNYDRAEEFVRKNRNILIGAGVVILLVVGFLVFRNIRLANQNEQAQPLMAAPQNYFALDSFRLALYGDQVNPGFLTIIDQYSGTDAANLARYYAGISFLQLGEYQNAIDHLDRFSTRSDIIGARKYEALGHAYAELNNSDRAARNYRRAADNVDHEFFTPFYLQQAGDYYTSIGQHRDAERMYQRIKDNYPLSREFQMIDKYLEFAKNSQRAS